MAYSLIQFWENSDKLGDAVVPTNWILDGHVYWCNSINAQRALEQRVPLNLKWPCYKVRKIKLSDGMYTITRVHNNCPF